MKSMSAERIVAAALMLASSCTAFSCKSKQSTPPPSESRLKRQTEPNDPTEELTGRSQDTRVPKREPERVAKPTDDLADDRHPEDDVPKRPSEQPRRPSPSHEEEE